MTERPRLSIIIVNWNSKDDLRECLQSLRLQTHSDLEIIVVDNGSADGSIAMVEHDFPHCLLLAQRENLGFAEACNIGIAASRSPWVAMLNNDAVADPHWAETLINAAVAAPADCGMLQSLLLYKGRPNVINSAGIELAYSGGGRDRKEGKHYVPENETAEENIFCPTAGAAAYRREMLDAIRLNSGYFDSVHFLYYEDMDIGWRARLAGWSARYIPTSIVYHKWHGSSDRHGRRRLRLLANTNRIRMLLKNASLEFILATLPRTLKELGEIVWYGRVAALANLFSAVATSLRTRQQVTTMARVARAQVEKEYRARPMR